jgi:hypothetical protein
MMRGQGEGLGQGQVGRGTLQWPLGSGGEVKNQDQEVGVSMVEGWRRRRGK